MKLPRRALVQPLEPRTLFSTFALSDVASFTSAPSDALVENQAGTFFGTTPGGGANGAGSIYQVTSSGVVTTLASFSGGGGAGSTPTGPIAIDSAGNLFGTTVYGGAGGEGAIYELPHGSGTITVLASFDGANGATPGHAGVILDPAGDLFGATSGGGNTGGDGVVYELPHGSSTIDVLATFAGGDSADPQGRLVRDSAGNLFGTTRSVGGNGTVYEVAAGSHTITTLATFNGTNGQYPTGVLLEDSSGNLFGTTQSGGANNGGTLFEVPAGGAVVTVASLDASHNPIDSGLVIDTAGDVYGTTSSNPTNGDGSLFEVRAGTGTAVTLATFDGTLGSGPTALVSDGDNGLYGIATGGGANSAGALFHLSQTSSGPQATTTALQVSNSTSVTGQSVTFTAIVAPPSANDETPAGTVSFTANGNFLGSATLSSNGEASLSTTALPIGDNTVIASYAGDDDSLNSDSPAVVVSVTSSSSSPFSDSFAASSSRAAGTSLGGSAVESSPSDTWITSGGGFTFSTNNANTLNATDSGTDVARVYRSLASGSYTVAANLYPGTDPAGPYLGVGFLGGGNDPAAGDPLYFRIQTGGAYELDATGSSGAPTVLASGATPADTWSVTNPPRVDLTWNTAGDTASASINGVVVAADVNLSTVTGLDSSDVNSVGFAKQGDSNATLAVSNFTFTSNAAVSTTQSIGNLDTTFGTAGVASSALGFTSFVGSAVQGSDTLVLGDVAGGFAIARLNADGSLDTTFGTGGITTATFGGTGDTAAAIAVLGDGSLFVAGTASGSAFAVERFDASGAAATLQVLPNFSPGSTDTVHAMAVAPGGTIYLAGQTVPAGGVGSFAVAAVDESGAAVTGFAAAGEATVHFGSNASAYAVAVQSNGRVVVAGASGTSVALARLTTAGVLDKSFDRTGTAVTSVRGVGDAADSIAIAKNNAIVVGGYSASSSTSSDFLVIRYTAAGKVDKSFGRGPVITSLGQPSAVTQVAIDSAGDVVASGKTVASLTGFSGGDTNLAVARYNSKGAADATFGTAGHTIVDLGAINSGSTVPNGLSLFDTSGQGSLLLAGNDIDLFGDANGSTGEAALIGSAADLSTAVTTVTPKAAVGGKKISVAIKLTDVGNVASTDALSIALSLTTDGQELGSIPSPVITASINLKPGKSKLYHEKITVPTGLRGSYFVSAVVSGVTDLNAANNTAASATAIAVTPTK